MGLRTREVTKSTIFDQLSALRAFACTWAAENEDYDGFRGLECWHLWFESEQWTGCSTRWDGRRLQTRHAMHASRSSRTRERGPSVFLSTFHHHVDLDFLEAWHRQTRK